jgi:RsiW-degrading membrane proteinase PrsW (M82 family)
MIWRRYLQSRTRNPAFLWRMVIAILLAGVVVGLAADAAMPAWIHAEPGASAADPRPQPEPEPESWESIERLADAGEWFAAWLGIPQAIVNSWRHLGMTGLAVLTGLCWLAFSLQAIQVRGARDGRLWLPIAALALGTISVWPTLFLDLVQERKWSLTDSDEVTAGLRYYILSVGLREELAKSVCFLPLLPWVVRRRDELGALVVAGCVGLGFAMEENVIYIAGSVGTATLVRLLTPAPLHMAMTGLIGLAAYRACVWPREWAPIFFAMFGVVVLGHGLYDAFLSLPALVDYSLASTVIFVMLIYQFFRELRPLQKLRVEPISLTANFLFCVSTVAAATFVYLSAAVGWRVAADALAAGVLGQAVMVYLFLREMPETMVAV